MISVVIPTLDAQSGLPSSLAALVPAAVEGLVSEVLIVDGGSTDQTARIAEEAGADVVITELGRGLQLQEGGLRARGRWLLFLHADTVLEPGWREDARSFMDRVERGDQQQTAAAFRYGLDDDGIWPRILETIVGVRAGFLSLPYGDQGLLISRALYDEIGGYRRLKIMEDVDIVRRLGRRRLTILRVKAVTSAERYRRDGYLRRVLRNLACLLLYYTGVSDERIARFYGHR